MKEVTQTKNKPLRPQNYPRWNQGQLQRYVEFLILNRRKLDCTTIANQVAKEMKQHIVTERTPLQCVRQHRRYLKKFGSYEKVIKELTNKIRSKINDHEFQIWVSKELKRHRQKGVVVQNQALFDEIVEQISMEEQAFNFVLTNMNVEDYLIQQNQSKKKKLQQSSNFSTKEHLLNDFRLYPTKKHFVNNQIIDENQEMELQNQLPQKRQQHQGEVQEAQSSSNDEFVIRPLEIQQCWSKAEKLKFLVFVLKYKETFQLRKKVNAKGKKKFYWYIFTKMSKFIETKTKSQCRDHYKSLFGKNLSIQKCIEKLLQKDYSNPDDVKREIIRIEKFYKAHRLQQLNAFFCRQVMKVQISRENREIIEKMLNTNFQQCLTKNIRNSFSIKSSNVEHEENILLEDEQKKNTWQDQSFEIEIPILLQISFQNQGSIMREEKQKYPMISKNSGLNEASNLSYSANSPFVQVKPHNNLSQILYNIKAPSSEVSLQKIGIFYGDEDENMLNCSNQEFSKLQTNKQKMVKYEEKIQDKGSKSKGNSQKMHAKNSLIEEHWTVSEKIKFVLGISINKKIFLSAGQISQRYFAQLANIVGTGKTAGLCKQRFHKCKNKYQQNLNLMIEELSERFCVRSDLVQRRRKLNSNTQIFSKRVEAFNFTVEIAPSLLLVKKSKFNPSKLIDQMEQTDLLAKFSVKCLNINQFSKDYHEEIDFEKEQIEENLIKITLNFSSFPKQLPMLVNFLGFKMKIKHKFKFYLY